jgi:hypothetical protein
MSSAYSRRDAEPISPGKLKSRIYVYDPTQSLDSDGGVVRSPVAGGGEAGTAALSSSSTLLWADYAAIASYGERAAAAGQREVSVVYKVLTVRFSKPKPYKAGLVIQIDWSGEWVEVLSLELVDEDWRKYELTCRSVT